MVRTAREPLRVGERIVDAVLHGPDGRPTRLQQLIDDRFDALYFTDVRRRPSLPEDKPGLKHLIVSRGGAPLDSSLCARLLFDVGGRLRERIGCPTDTVLMVRPDDMPPRFCRCAKAMGCRRRSLPRIVSGARPAKAAAQIGIVADRLFGYSVFSRAVSSFHRYRSPLRTPQS